MTTREEQRESLGVGVIVLSQDKKHVLLGERKNAFKAGWLGMPGGRVEGNEAIVETAKRELQEEAGLDADQVSYVGVVREWQGTYSFIHFGFIVTKFSGEVTNREPEKCTGWEWYSLNNLPKKILPGHKSILDIYLAKENGFVDIL
jgi:8-oxo-dGTP diphosphatase